MDKIQKALAKLYFALGESKPQIPAGSEITDAIVEYFAFRAIRNTGETVGKKYFAMGAAAAFRKAAKLPRGKKPQHPETGKLQPSGGKKRPAAQKKAKNDDDFNWDESDFY